MKNNLLILLVTMVQLSSGSYATAAELDAGASLAESPGTTAYPLEAADPALELTTSAEEAEIDHTISRYTEEVSRLERENGAYNNDLTEELISLGRAYSNAGNHAEALKVYQRALHINRINTGLHNLEQLTILELVIEANTALQNYAKLTDNYAYMLWVYNRNFGGQDPRLLPVYDRIANWHLDAFEKTEFPESLTHLVIAANLFDKALETVKLTKGINDPDMIKPLYGIVHANFKLIEPYGYIRDIDMITGNRAMPVPLLPSNFSTNVDNGSMMRNRFIDQNYNRDNLSRVLEEEENTISLIQNSYKSGRGALERIIDIHLKNPGLPRKSLAYALTHMGDWYQRFSKRDASTRYYQQAYALLTEISAGPEVIQELFGRPVSLDSLNVPHLLEVGMLNALAPQDMSEKSDLDIEQKMTSNNLKDVYYVVAEFDVTAYGSIRNLDFIGSNPVDDIRFRRMARDRITTTPFRPRMEDGKPIATENVKMYYTFEE